jgi:hydroxymethylglutaryl-CoA reductase
MSDHPTSRLVGLHRMTPAERRATAARDAGVDPAALAVIADPAQAGADLLDRMVENVIGGLTLPVGLATNLILDGRERVVPMATEESSVVAAVCNAARLCRESGGVRTDATAPLMIAQVQILDVPDPARARQVLLGRRAEILERCDACDPVLVRHGGGARDVEVRVLHSEIGPLVVVHLIVDVRDAMGANSVNTMAESLAPTLAAWAGGRHHLRILSNLADRRLARATAVWSAEALGGEEVVAAILAAHAFAEADPYRAATHNKGIMNGIAAVMLATGNDTRAIEAGAHAYAARLGQYGPLSRFERTAAGDLAGSLELPLACGIIGGATRLHPTARACLQVMAVERAEDLARITVAVGLCQNFAALRALATVGIQEGHMALHAQNVAIAAGAEGEEITAVAAELVVRKQVRQDVAETVLAEMRDADG